MADQTNRPGEEDWELAEGFYQEDEEKKELKLEDFLEGNEEHEPGLKLSKDSDEMQKTIAEVHQVLTLAEEGKTIDQIAEITGLDRAYVYNIQVCAQGFHEDDEIAVAHLVMG